jgi:RNA polymerase sigma-70 factor (ECF subfamily)
MPRPDDPAEPPANAAPDEVAFTALAQRHRRELLVHCYRMLGSLHDAEDAVQESLLRAWRYRETVEANAPLRSWLYRVATNVCLDVIARDERRRALASKVSAGELQVDAAELDQVTWLEPLPDALLEPVAPRDGEPESALLTRETIELSFLTVIQLLTPQQRAALILRDLLGWSAKETAELLEVTVAAANSALQRARATLRERFPSRRPAWPAGVDASAAERELLERYVAAAEEANVAAIAALIREDATFRMPPVPGVWVGRDAVIREWVDSGFGSESFGQMRCRITRANGQPAVAAWIRRDGDPGWGAAAIDVLRIEEGRIAEIVTFGAEVFPSFGLPAMLPDA